MGQFDWLGKIPAPEKEESKKVYISNVKKPAEEIKITYDPKQIVASGSSGVTETITAYTCPKGRRFELNNIYMKINLSPAAGIAAGTYTAHINSVDTTNRIFYFDQSVSAADHFLVTYDSTQPIKLREEETLLIRHVEQFANSSIFWCISGYEFEN